MNSTSSFPRRLIVCASLLAALASTTAVSAQVYSVNAVGYADVNLAAGSNFISNPLINRNNSISNLIPSLPAGSYIKRWNPAQQDFDSTNLMTASGWTDPAATLLLPEGVALWAPAAAKVSFTGELYQGAVTGRTAMAGIHILGVMPRRAFFVCGNFSECLDSSWPPLETTYYQWNPLQQRFSAYFYFDDSLGWIDEFGNPANPTIPPGQSGLFYVSTTFYLPAVPNPAPPNTVKWAMTLSQPKRTATNVTFMLTATNVAPYGVWRSIDVPGAVWKQLALGTSSVGAATVTLDDSSNNAAFYRIGTPITNSGFGPALTSGLRTSNQFSFSFCVSSNTSYAVDRTTTINPTAWNQIQVITVDEKSCVTFTDSNAVTARAYYRLRQMTGL